MLRASTPNWSTEKLVPMCATFGSGCSITEGAMAQNRACHGGVLLDGGLTFDLPRQRGGIWTYSQKAS
jgi:hypothetical protein